MIRIITTVAVAFALAFTIVAFGVNGTHAQSAEGTPAAMTGTWAGDAQIFVNWTVQRTLPVRLAMASDNRVSGTVGDASLRNGRLERNRTAIGRALHVKTDWIVRGDLEGDVIRAEGIRRESVSIPLDWIDDHFQGAVNTSGGQFGGKKSMWLAAGRLRLDRARNK